MKIRPRCRPCKALSLCVFLVAYSAGGLRAQVSDSAQRSVTLQISSRITVAMADSLNSSTARVGQEFGVVTTEPVTDVFGTVAAPSGTPAVGRILHVQKAGVVAREATLVIGLREIRIGGQAYPIRTNSIDIGGGRGGWLIPLEVDMQSGRTFEFTLVEPVTLPVAP